MTKGELLTLVDNIHFTKDYEENLSLILKLIQLQAILVMKTDDLINVNRSKVESEFKYTDLLLALNNFRMPARVMIDDIKDNKDSISYWNGWFKDMLIEIVDSILELDEIGGGNKDTIAMIYYILIQEDKDNDDQTRYNKDDIC